METIEGIYNACLPIAVVGLIGTITLDIIYIIRRKRQNENRKPKPGTSAPRTDLKTKVKMFFSQMYRWVQTSEEINIATQAILDDVVLIVIAVSILVWLVFFGPSGLALLFVLLCVKHQTNKQKRPDHEVNDCRHITTGGTALIRWNIRKEVIGTQRPIASIPPPPPPPPPGNALKQRTA